jgi:pimeloyl-ACP methyl ester carboxylesterase
VRTRDTLVGYVAAVVLATSACHTGSPTANPTGTPTGTSTATATATDSTPTGTASPSATVKTAADVPPAVVAEAVRTYGAQSLAWKGCGGGFECADLTVPLDYGQADGDTIKVAVIRLKARDRAHRLGAVVLNPGGPGASGVEFARSAPQLLPNEILNRFDTVSFDPRGVAKTAPVDCAGDATLDTLLSADPTPDDAAERGRLFQLNRSFADACAAKNAKLLPHLSTIDTARDLDVLRVALREPKLTYVGFSYGTVLGARYAQQFPTHIRAFVLDGAVDPRLSSRAITLAQAMGFEQALRAFLDDCTAQHCAFSLHGGAGKAFDTLLARVERHPLSASRYPGRSAGPSEVLFGVAAGLYSREFYWPVLRDGLEAAYTQGDGSQLIALFDNLVERDENGHYSNSVEAQTAITCVDGDYAHDDASYERDAVEFAKKAPRFGEALAYGPVACAHWAVPPAAHSGAVSAPGAPPILVVGTTRDPATPYAWAVALSKQLPGRLLTYEGDGHTAYGYHRSACVERLVDAYLLTLTLPGRGARCG